MSVTGAGGLPEYTKAGNVVRAKTSLRLSIRLAPNKDPNEAAKQVREKLTTDVPYNCKVTVEGDHNGKGWCMNEMKDWEKEIMSRTSNTFFGKDWGSYGMGGSIPFLAQLGQLYPKTNILAMGVLGPGSNAHGPNESINLAYTKKLTMALSNIVCEFGAHK